MFSQKIPYCPADFADKIKIEAVNLSSKTKTFLNGINIETVLQFSKIPKEYFTLVTHTQTRRELEDFSSHVKEWMKKQVKKLHYTRSFPQPPKSPKGEEKATIIALILAEPLLGNRRNMTIARTIHLKELYSTKPSGDRRRPVLDLRRLNIAS